MKRHKFYAAIISVILLFTVSFQADGQQLNAYLSFENGILQNADHFNTLPFRETANGGEEYYSIDFSFPGANIANTSVNGTGYQFLHIKGFAPMGQIGAPALPAHNEVIAMPPGAEGNIVIINSSYHEYDGYMIHPALEPALDTDGAPDPEFWIDDEIYNKDEFFPKSIVEITNVALNRGIPLAYTQIRPVQFNPVTGKIRVYTLIDFKLEYKGNKQSFTTIANDNSLHFTNKLKRLVINSDNIPEGITGNTESKLGEKEYIIITHDQYLTAANDLANWKRQMGYSVEVVSSSSWTEPQVQSAVQTRYDAWSPKPDYFVIFGDHDGSYAVPGKVINTPYSAPDDGPFATDLYHACMDGGTDWHPDIAWGRISASSLTEANVIVNKIINYEKNPPTTESFYTDVLNCAQYQDDDNNGYADRRFCHTSEDIRDYLQDEFSYNSTRVYHTDATTTLDTRRYNNTTYSNGQLIPAELRSPSFNWVGGATEITNAIDAGKFMVFHRDHGYVGGSGWHRPYYTTTSMNSLNNGDLLPVVFSINCHTGEYQLSNCFAEKFMRMENKGAVGVVGASFFSLSGWNDAISVGMIDAIWADPGLYPVFGTGGTGANYTIGAGNEIRTMGDVLLQGLYCMEQNFNGHPTYDRYEYELFMYFGDPAMSIWTENPNSSAITATHSATIDCSVNTFSISGSTAGATATLVFDNELLGVTVLDGSGAGTINYSITGSGTFVKLTISKTDHKPYVTDLNLVGACNPPAVVTNAVTSISQTSATLNGDIQNDFGNTITESGFVYGTGANPVIGGTGVIQIQTSPVHTFGTYSEPLTGLIPATSYFVKAYAISVGGTGYGAVDMFTTSCGIISTLPFTQDFSAGAIPSCWAIIDNDGSGLAWTFVDPNSRPFSSTTAGNGYALMDSDAYGDGNSQDADLVTPEFDFSGFASVNLEFQHVFRSYAGSSIELLYSINGGSNWTSIQAWTADIGNYTTGAPVTFSQDLTSEVAGQSSVKFKWNYTGSWGYYWLVDDISITGVEGGGTINQMISLTGGWNILSFSNTPTDPDMLTIVQPLIDGSSLVKVTSQSGGFIQYIVSSWMNTIGDMSNAQGYYVNVTGATTLNTSGPGVTFPFDIPLLSGWNIMGYPCEVSQTAITVLQPLIDAGYLVKVVDESGGFIQFIPGIGWINSINTFEPGKGYYVNVNSNSTLTLTDPGKGTDPFIAPEAPQTEYFSSLTSNPFSPMNVLISDIYSDDFSVEDGDEIAVYDGLIEVGSMVVQQTDNDFQMLTLRADDPTTEIQDGFIAGGELTFRYWDKSENILYTDIEVTQLFGNKEFTRLGTFGADLKIGSLGLNENGLPNDNYLSQNYPNPYTENTYIEYGIAEDAHVLLSVYDVYGRKVKEVEDMQREAGNYKLTLNRSSLESGIYYYRLDVIGQNAKFSETRKMILY
jgi:hypothetical protein